MKQSEALKCGLPRYYGKVCQRHPTLNGERYTANWGCVACRLESAKKNASTKSGKDRLAKYAKRPDRALVRAASRARYNKSAAGRAKKAKSDAIYKSKYPEKIADRLRSWHAKNPDAHRMHRQNYKNRKKVGSGISVGISNRLMILQKGKCTACMTSLFNGFHIDHIMPLALGGRHEDVNIQLLCPHCNLVKNKKHPVDFMQSIGRLL